MSNQDCYSFFLNIACLKLIEQCMVIEIQMSALILYFVFYVDALSFYLEVHARVFIDQIVMRSLGSARD